MSKDDRGSHVVIVGGGFAGMSLARGLAKHDHVKITLIDKNAYHQFQPLLYQVATFQLAPQDIAFPLAKLFDKDSNVEVKTAEVTAIDPATKSVTTGAGETIKGDY